MRVQNQYRSTKSNGAFTLIELLIVVAIIAILAAIAVPNFMEAQVRSKVSRSKADLRAVATALETYRIDHRTYPPVGSFAGDGMGWPYAKRLMPVTTPIAYITTLPEDVFAKPEERFTGTGTAMGLEYVYTPGNIFYGVDPRYQSDAFRGTIYSLSGRGPNKVIDYGYSLAHPEALKNKRDIQVQYDPTNGTLSGGDVVTLSCARM